MNPLIQMGRWLFMATLLLSFAAALRQLLQTAGQPRLRRRTFAALRRAAPWALALLAGQSAVIAAALLHPVARQMAVTAEFYLAGALALPVFYAAGRQNATALRWPQAPRRKWTRRRKLVSVLAVFAAGFLITAGLFSVGRVETGESIRAVSDTLDGDVLALGLFAIWLLINAPWLEELVFRHFALSCIARGLGGSATAVAVAIAITSLVFAVGHAGHTVPVWPKMAQMLAWAGGLCWARIFLGTPYAIGLHLAWNLSTPLVSLMLQ